MELSIDTADPVAGVALTDHGELVADLAWRSRAGHAAELLPAIDTVFRQAQVEREKLEAIFICRGPGGYAGLRVGVSTAMGLAFALGVNVLGVNRLEADAWTQRSYPGPVVAIHAAGRGDYAWAVYTDMDGWHNVSPARITNAGELIAAAPSDALLCGQVDDALVTHIRESRADLIISSGPAHRRRAITIAALAWSRFERGDRDDPAAIEPVYLREPNITRKSAP